MQIFIEFFMNNRYQFTMPTQKPQILLTLTKELLKKLKIFASIIALVHGVRLFGSLLKRDLKKSPHLVRNLNDLFLFLIWPLTM